MVNSILKNEIKQKHLNKDGFTIINLLNLSDCYDFLQWKKEKNLTDTNTYSKGSQTYSIQKYQENHNFISDKISEQLNHFFQDYKIIFSRFLLKKCAKDAFIPAHQDRQFTDLDDDKFPSYIIWIPLVDVNLYNGTIGFLKGSHKTYKAPPPPFPDPKAKRFNDETIFNLFPYLNFVKLKAGQAVIFNIKTYHGSLPNFSKHERPAIRIDICHEEAQLFCYFLNKKSDGKLMDKYAVNDSFYTRFPNEKLLEIYNNDETFPEGELVNSQPYFLSKKSIKEYLVDHEILMNEKTEFDTKVSLIVSRRKYVSNFEASFFSIFKSNKNNY